MSDANGPWSPSSSRPRGRLGWRSSRRCSRAPTSRSGWSPARPTASRCSRSTPAATVEGASADRAHGEFPRRLGHPPAPCRARSQGRQRGDPGGSRRRGDVAAAADQGARSGRPLLCAPSRSHGAEGRVPRRLRPRARRAREHHGRGRQPDRDLARAGHRRELAPGRLQFRSAGRAGAHRHTLLPGPALVRDRRQVRLRLPDHDPRHGAARRRPALSRSRRRRGAGAGGDAGDAGCLPARLRGRGAEAARRVRQDRAGAGGRRRSVPDHRQAAAARQLAARVAEACGARMQPAGCISWAPRRSA